MANGSETGPLAAAANTPFNSGWMNSAAGRPLSLSLPFTGGPPLKGERIRNFFDNLLSDSEVISSRIATRFKTESAEPFDLLQAIGRDFVGAVQLLGADEMPASVEHIMGCRCPSRTLKLC